MECYIRSSTLLTLNFLPVQFSSVPFYGNLLPNQTRQQKTFRISLVPTIYVGHSTLSTTKRTNKWSRPTHESGTGPTTGEGRHSLPCHYYLAVRWIFASSKVLHSKDSKSRSRNTCCSYVFLQAVRAATRKNLQSTVITVIIMIIIHGFAVFVAGEVMVFYSILPNSITIREMLYPHHQYYYYRIIRFLPYSVMSPEEKCHLQGFVYYYKQKVSSGWAERKKTSHRVHSRSKPSQTQFHGFWLPTMFYIQRKDNISMHYLNVARSGWR